MVQGRRRNSWTYSLNVRWVGITGRERLIMKVNRRSYPQLLALSYGILPINVAARYILALRINQNKFIQRIINVPNPIFVNRHRDTNSFDNDQLHEMRIWDRSYIPQLIAALQVPNNRWECDNGCVESLETGILMWFYFTSFPRKLHGMQREFGREYSQISRVLETIWSFMDLTWGHLVTNNLPWFQPRLELHNNKFSAKYLEIWNVPPAPYWQDISLFTDGTQVQMNRDIQVNFSGHKSFYCFGYLVTCGMDGMFVDIQGPYAGSLNDHTKQNLSNLSVRLAQTQQGFARLFKTATDKGCHRGFAVAPMHNHAINTFQETLENTHLSSLRSTNENDISRLKNTMKFIDYRKVQFNSLQPLGIYFRVCSIMLNALTIRRGTNPTAEFYDCMPPNNLGAYFV